MVGDKVIQANYSSKLDPMTRMIGSFFLYGDDSEISRMRLYKGVSDFCFNNDEVFRKAFSSKIGFSPKEVSNIKADRNDIQFFINHLSKMDGECVFLLRDAFLLMKNYQSKNDKGFGLLLNRNYLCSKDNEQDYFKLIGLFYESLEGADNLNDFLHKYEKLFKNLLSENHNFRKKSLEIYEYIKKRYREKIIWVDYGFQFTFVLFAYFSIKIHSKGMIKQDFFNFTAYVWLQEFFKDKIFSKKSEVVLEFENDALCAYEQDLLKKTKGALVGFAIGDSLGFPAAGVNISDLDSMIDMPITDFQSSKLHPFFSHLDIGQYTDNTNFIITAAKSLISNKGLNIDSYVEDLKSWFIDLISKNKSKRWPGPTAARAFENLVNGSSYENSGSLDTESCSATYRVIPLGIVYRSFYKQDFYSLNSYSSIVAQITHNSMISKTGAAIFVWIVSDLLNGFSPKRSVLNSLQELQNIKDIDVVNLIDKIKLAVEMSESQKSDDKARQIFGTGSPIYQTLPLSIFYFLKYKDNFKKGILAAANSYRNDSTQEKERLKDFSWEAQLKYSMGGNTDGIAALTGSLIGIHVGSHNISEKFKSRLENYTLLCEIAENLVVI